MGCPGVNLPDNTLIARRGYACLHSAKYKTPLWVSYYITRQDLSKSVERSDKFRPDPDLVFGFRAELADYKSSGFDRGHMAPNKDMSRNMPTQAESFYLSNIVPQNRPNNQRFWKELENRFRGYVFTYGSLFIISGPIYGKPLPSDCKGLPASVGKDHVGVPTWLFKIAVRKLPNGHYDAIAIEVPNAPISSKLADYSDCMACALTSIDQIEADTGFDFLNALSKAEQKRIESKKAPELWPLPKTKN